MFKCIMVVLIVMLEIYLQTVKLHNAVTFQMLHCVVTLSCYICIFKKNIILPNVGLVLNFVKCNFLKVQIFQIEKC